MDDLIEPRRYTVGSLFSNPAFWAGARATRVALFEQVEEEHRAAHAAAVTRIDEIVTSLQAGNRIADTPAFRRWLAYSR